MKKEYSQKDIERILNNNAEIPESVDERIRQTYLKLGLGEKCCKRYVSRKKVTRRTWMAVAAAAVLTAGLGITAFAVGRFLEVRMTGEEKTDYQITIHPEQKEAHKISVEPEYIPDGYVSVSDGAYSGKWNNESTGGSMTIVSYNAAELYFLSETGDGTLGTLLDMDDYTGTEKVDGMQMDVFYEESIYTDSEEEIQQAYLFNEEYGYALRVYLSGTDLPKGEAEKVAKGLRIEVLDETVPYPSEEELEEYRAGEDMRASADTGEIPEDSFYDIGDTIQNPYWSDDAEDTKECVKVTDIKIVDSMPAAEYPAENYVRDYNIEIVPFFNEDGTLKEHGRYRISDEGYVLEDTIENVGTKFVIATVERTNLGTDTKELYIAPQLELLGSDASGNFKKYSYEPAEMAYHKLVVDGLPFYQSVQQFTESEKSHVYFAELAPDETLTCTFAFPVDEDCVDDAYLAFYHYDGMTNTYPRVKVTDK